IMALARFEGAGPGKLNLIFSSLHDFLHVLVGHFVAIAEDIFFDQGHQDPLLPWSKDAGGDADWLEGFGLARISSDNVARSIRGDDRNLALVRIERFHQDATE